MTVDPSNLNNTIGKLFPGAEGAAIAAEMKAAREAAATKKTKKPKITKVVQPSIFSPTKAKAEINKVFNAKLGRNATATELKKYSAALIKAQKENPSVQTTDVVGTTMYQSSIGGLNAAQWLSDQIQSDKKLLPELTEVGTIDPAILKRQVAKEEYDAAIKAAKGDAQKIAQINATSTYGLSVNRIKDQFMSEANKAGAIVDENTLLNLAKEAVDTYQDRSPDNLSRFITGKLRFTPTQQGSYSGEAASNYNDLAQTAMANGLDLNKTFGNQLPAWLQAINNGESVDNFKKLIRDTAKIGMPEKVTKLMDQGLDLKAVYAPYQNLMESILELPNGSVGLNDPTLRTAITSQQELPLYDFQRLLRKDSRWQYTDNARQEVASIAQSVLKDFGFQG